MRSEYLRTLVLPLQWVFVGLLFGLLFPHALTDTWAAAFLLMILAFRFLLKVPLVANLVNTAQSPGA